MYKVGNSTYGYTTLTRGTMNYPAIGTAVSRFGAQSNITYGTISRLVGTLEIINSLRVTDLIEVTPSVTGRVISGDSGGPIWSNGYFLGILSGVNTITGVYYFTPYRYIQAAGFTAYASHQISSWTDYSSSQHRGYCSICRNYILEAHAGFLNSSGTCTRCGHSGTSVAP